MHLYSPACLFDRSFPYVAFFLCSPQTGCCRMAPFLEAAHRLGWILLKALLRFTFMFINNCVAIPSYCLYLIVLQPLRIMDSQTFWYIEGVMFRWLLAMVASWGWFAGYTGKDNLKKKIFVCCTPKIEMHQAFTQCLSNSVACILMAFKPQSSSDPLFWWSRVSSYILTYS